MISIHCTSCKKALEVDENTLSSREASVMRCPNCGVTLTVDKRKATTPIVTGPVVKVATDVHEPLPPAASGDELTLTGGCGEYVTVVNSTYATAESYLRTNAATAKRSEELSGVKLRAGDAIRGMQLQLPPPSSRDDVNDAVAAPDDTRLDAKLHLLADYLSTTHTIVDLAREIWKDVTAPHAYEPIIQWQSQAGKAVEAAYVATARHSPPLSQQVARLQGVAAEYASLVKQHGHERAALQKQVAAKEQDVAKLRDEAAAAREKCATLEDQAETAAMNALKGSGCGAAIAAAIAGTVIAVSARSGVAGWISFFAVLAGVMYIAYRFGFNKNETAKWAAHRALRNVESNLRSAEQEVLTWREKLGSHEAIAPEHVKPVLSGAWSLLNCSDFEAEPSQLTVSAGERVGPRVLHARGFPERVAASASVPAVPAAMIAAASGNARVSVNVAGESALPRAVGFKPSQESRAAATAFAGTVEAVSVAAPSIAAPVASEPEHKSRRLAVISAIAIVVIAVASYLIWSSTFSLEARMNEALAAGQMFTPAGASVYDLYKTELARRPGSRTLARLNPAIRDAIAPQADESFARWYKDSDDTVNWPELERICEFLSLIEPGTKLHQMRKLYAAAQQSIDAREYPKAISSYEEALKLDGTWVLALNGIGKVYMIERSPFFNERLGVAYYERACNADPGFTWAAKNLGDYYIRKNNYALAEPYLRRALSTSPERPSILRALGYVCRKTGRRREAVELYERALLYEKDPEKVASIMKALSAVRDDR